MTPHMLMGAACKAMRAYMYKLPLRVPCRLVAGTNSCIQYCKHVSTTEQVQLEQADGKALDARAAMILCGRPI